MRVAVISDQEQVGGKIRSTLLAQGIEMSQEVIPLGRAASLADADNLDLVFVVLSPQVQSGLKAVSELHLVSRAKILAVGPTRDSRIVLQAIHAGAADFVDETAIETELVASLGRLHKEIITPSKEFGKVIGVLSPSGGSGSRTVAANLATALAKEHKKSLVVDLKLYAGDIAALLDVQPNYTLAEVCQNAARMDRVMFERSLVGLPSGVQILASPQNYKDVAAVTPDGIRQVLNLSRSLFPYVVIDLDHSFQAEQLEAVQVTDLLLLVLRLDFVSLRNVRRALDYLGHIGMHKDKLRVVVNRHGQPSEVPVQTAEEALGLKIFHMLPDDPRTVNDAINNGVPVVIEKPSTRLARSLMQLAHNVNGRVSR
jgi:pilus assembly protein CpaE